MKTLSSFCLLALVMSLFSMVFGCSRSETNTPPKFNAAVWEQKINSPTLTADEFTQLYAQAAAADVKVAQVQIIGTLEVLITTVDGFKLKSSLGNTWAEAVKNPNRRADICRYYLNSVLGIAKQRPNVVGAADTNNVVPTIKDDLFLSRFANDSSEHRLVAEQFVADLHIVYATDREGIIAFLMESDRNRFNLEFSELRNLAVANLKRVLHPIQRRGDGPAFMLTTGDGYSSSLLLLDDLWKAQTNSVQGEIVAVVPARDILLFTGSASAEGLKQLRQTAEKIYDKGDHVISKTLLVRRDGHWEQFKD